VIATQPIHLLARGCLATAIDLFVSPSLPSNGSTYHSAVLYRLVKTVDYQESCRYVPFDGMKRPEFVRYFYLELQI
jgi:hypothetical protein